MPKYRSRNVKKKKAAAPKSLPRQKPTGGGIFSDAKKILHHGALEHTVSDLQKVIEKVPEAAHVVRKAMTESANLEYHPIFPRFQRKRPDRSFDAESFARKIYHEHAYAKLPTHRGGSIKTLMKVGKNLSKLNPMTNITNAKANYDKVNFNDWSTRGIIKNGFHIGAGHAHLGASHMAIGSAVAAATGVGIPESAALAAGSTGMLMVGSGLNKAADKY